MKKSFYLILIILLFNACKKEEGCMEPLAENYNATDLVDSCLAKNIRKTVNILNENNYSNEDCILIIRTFLSKAKRLLRLQEEVDKND